MKKSIEEKIKNSLEGLSERAAARRRRQLEHSEKTKEWKEREKKIKKGELPEPRRRSCYLP